jgi:hypothetical protein
MIPPKSEPARLNVGTRPRNACLSAKAKPDKAARELRNDFISQAKFSSSQAKFSLRKRNLSGGYDDSKAKTLAPV